MSGAPSLSERETNLAASTSGTIVSSGLVRSASPRLRVGLLIDSPSQPKWIWDIVRDIRDSSTSEIVTVIIDDAYGSEAPSGWRSFGVGHRHMLYSLYSKLDQRFFPTNLDVLAPTDIMSLLNGCTSVRLSSPNSNRENRLAHTDVEVILAQHLDVALHFGSRVLRGKALGIAKYGVWAYRHGTKPTAARSSVGFWEVMERRPVTTSMLYVLSDEDSAAKVIYRSSARTHPRSVRRNRTSALSKASAFTIRKLRDLYEDGPVALESEPRHHLVTSQLDQARPLPTNGEMLRFLSGLVRRYLKTRISHYLGTEQWFLAYDIQRQLATPRTSLPAPTRMTPIFPPTDRFWADPFPVKKEGGYYVFFEERPSLTKKGFLSVLEIDDTGRVGVATKVLEKPYHISYPFVFEWESEYYLVPESAANKTVELYRAVEFPYRWELDRVLLKNVNAVDATIHQSQNRWWMFVNIALPGASSCDELHIYHAPTPRGPWVPHRRNPIKSDASNARPAGRIFAESGEFYRPAQDCSTRYGASIIINRIVRLDLESYEEIETSRILPDWQPNLIATHTINRVDRLTVVDAKRIRPRWRRSG